MFKINYPTIINGCNNLYLSAAASSSIQTFYYKSNPVPTSIYIVANLYYDDIDKSIIAAIIFVDQEQVTSSLQFIKLLNDGSIDTSFDTISSQLDNNYNVIGSDFFTYKNIVYFIIYSSAVGQQQPIILVYSVDRSTGDYVPYSHITTDNCVSSCINGENIYYFLQYGKILYSTAIDNNTPTYFSSTTVEEVYKCLTYNDHICVLVKDAGLYKLRSVNVNTGWTPNEIIVDQLIGIDYKYMIKYDDKILVCQSNQGLTYINFYQYIFNDSTGVFSIDDEFGNNGLLSLQIAGSLFPAICSDVNNNIYIIVSTPLSTAIIYSFNKFGSSNKVFNQRTIEIQSNYQKSLTINNSLYMAGATSTGGIINTTSLSGSAGVLKK